MKMYKMRFLSGLLAALLLLGALASCASTTENGPADGTSTEKETTDQAPSESAAPEKESNTADTSADTKAPGVDVETSDEREDNQLPADLDFGGEEFIIYSRYREGWTSGEIAAEKITSDLINDKVFERNKAVEEELHIKIKSLEEHNDDPYVALNKVSTLVTSGTHEFDLFACACYATLTKVLTGDYADLRATDYLNLDQPWWSQGFNEALEYQDSQYVATGSALLSMYRFAFITVFNKNMFEDHDVPYLYDDVRNHKWTLDRQIELAPLFHMDGGIQGEQDEKGDVYGLVTNSYISVDPYWSACKVDILGRNPDTGSYELIFDSNKLHNVTEKLMALFYEDTKNSVYVYEHYGLDDEQADIRNMFANDGAAMATLRILELENQAMRNMKSVYGVVPMPMYDENQDDYSTFLHDQVTVFSIPATIWRAKDADRIHKVSAMMEQLAWESHYTVRPAYYDTTLRTKLAQDPDSAAMMDTIVSNIYIDAGILYTTAVGNFHDTLRQIMISKNNTVTSNYKSIVTRVERRLLPNMLDDLDDVKSKAESA